MIGEMTMIERVYRQASLVLDEVFVATDDDRIRSVVEGFGGRCVMTSPDHKSGTDRCYEAYTLCGTEADVVINIQGDEPFIAPEQIESLMHCFDTPHTDIATLVRPFDAVKGWDALFNPNTPKVTFDKDMRALYFSRSIIPYVRGVEWEKWLESAQFYTHIGMYAYRTDTLAQIVELPQSSLELAESLEQLRWLQNGYTIRVGISSCETIGIDTPDDLEAACRYLQSMER